MNDTGYTRKRVKTDFQKFIVSEYFPWKYTDCRFSERWREELNIKSKDQMDIISQEIMFFVDKVESTGHIGKELFHEGVELKKSINGVGVAGITGLLSLLVPEVFGTVDQYVVRAMMHLGSLKRKCKNPADISVGKAVEMECIMFEKSKELSKSFKMNNWRPRDIDMVLWSYGR